MIPSTQDDFLHQYDSIGGFVNHLNHLNLPEYSGCSSDNLNDYNQ